MRTSIITAVIVIVVAAVAAAGGYFYGTSVGEARANQIRQDFFAQRGQGGTQGTNQGTGQGGAQGGGGFFGAGGRGGTIGTVKSISGNTMQVSTRDSVVNVTLSDKTTVEKQATGSLSDITPGMRVVVVGQQGSGGAVTAQSIQIVPNAPQGAGNQPGRNQPGTSQQGGTPSGTNQQGGNQ